MTTSQKVLKYFREGRRIYLREVCIADADGNYSRWMNDPDVIQYLESRFTPVTLPMLQSYITQEQQNLSVVFMAIVVKENDTHIGNIKIHRIDYYHRFAEISLIIGEKAYWGNGYGTEAIQLAVDFAFSKLNLHKLSANIYSSNAGSVKAFKKAGFSDEGLRIKHRFYKGEYIDEVMLGIARQEN
jgi:RimJ/RimL family protein N-acetyltransferase